MARPRKQPVGRRHGVSVGMELINGNELVQALQKLVYEVQTTVLTKASQDGRRQQSSKTKQKWSGAKKLKTTIRSVVRPQRKFGQIVGRLGLVGPSYSDGGGHGNLFSRDHNRKVLWGRDAGTVRKVNQFVKRTADETKSAAASAVKASLKAGIDAAAKQAAN
jgi:predicted Rdx family selenoprotein